MGCGLLARGWRRLFRLQEHTYVELCVEFSLPPISKNGTKEITLTKLAWRLDPYNRLDVLVDDEVNVPRDHRNVTPRVEDYEPRGYSMEDMIHYMSMVPSAGARRRYTYIPSWEEKLVECGGGTGMSGANQDGADEDD
ncbi:unnamed protein product [Lactuca saligna]|uniref:Uncharacterized protein n=1 Tax=Lactuca saligna TaxID=75948 RepID=A0AA35Y8J9_LACSI|nr:unnamed protein product [Lactuca saligna]